MVASLSNSLKLCHLLPTSRLLNSRLAAFSISDASLSSSSLPQSNSSPSPSLSHRLSRFLKSWMWLPENEVKERKIFSKLLLFISGAFGFSFATWHVFLASDKFYPSLPLESNSLTPTNESRSTTHPRGPTPFLK
ncbi:hypothetical protein FCM35_KLT06807 [Carex littledalei]|uniref:Uncharacterized protein n=1 Tax=Carex littledalei TaxID=544730 RepID=A0A833QUM8_9POAL|nr:hypothetical protein FCM35_KLT06807 [Carex littledalei]